MSRIRISDLAPGITYGIQLRTNTGDAVSVWSRIFNLTTNSDLVAPNTPVGVSATMDGTAFNLFWSKVTLSADGTPALDLDHYEVLVTSTGTATSGIYLVNDNKFQFTLDMNRTLFGTPRANVIMQVRAVDKVGNASAYSATFSQTNPAPANPTGFSGVAISDGFTFKWTGVADADLLTYRIYSGTTSGSQTTLEWSGLANNASIQSTLYSTDKWFRVVAVDVFGTESPSGPVVGPLRPNSPFTVDTLAPATPTGLAATLTNSTDGKTASAAVSWTAVTDTDNDLSEYIVGYKPSSASDWQYDKVDYTNTSTTINGLLPYTNYDFRVRASDFSANLSAWSSVLTKTATANAAPAVPTGLAVSPSRDSLRIVWNLNTEPDMANGAGVYDVQVSAVSDFSSTLTYRTGANQIVVNALLSGTTYYTRVKAVDSGGVSSAYSSTVSTSTGAPISAFAYTRSATAPTSPNVGDIWMDTTSGFEKQWSGSTWVVTGNVSLQYLTSKGTDLVTNGTGLMGNNYNFPSYDYDGTDAPVGVNGSFVIKTTAAQSALINELIPFDPTKQYKFSFQCRQTVAGQTNTMYGFFAPYDAFNNTILPQHYMYVANTTTTLAAPLNPGDTTITLTSSANWYGQSGKPAGNLYYLRGIIFWDYVDNNGKAWPVGSYSRNTYLGTIASTPSGGLWSDGGITGNVITLNNPWTGPAKAAGTSLSSSSTGSSFIYMPSATNTIVPQTWTQYGDVFNSGIMSPSAQAVAGGGAATWSTGMPPGTAKFVIGWLMNYPSGGTGKHAIAAVSVSDASAAQTQADAAYAMANGKNKIIRSTSAASGTSGYVAGDLWWQIDGSGNAIGQWKYSGTAWVSEQLASQVIANLDVNKLTAGSGFITTLNIASGGAIQSAGYTSGGTTGFQLSTSGLTIKGTGNTVDAGVLKGGIITGTTINVGVGGTLNIDSTGVVKSNNYAAGSTGYQLSNTGLELNDGTVDAKTLKTGTAIIGDLTIGRSADALGTIKSFDYVAGTTGWKIGKGLFEINQGTVRAAALQIQDSDNLESPEYASFDFVPAFYTGKLPVVGATNTIVTSGARFGNQYLQSRATAAAAFSVTIGANSTDYHIPVEPSTTYIFSAYMKTGAVASNVSMRARLSTGAYTTSFGTTALAANGAWQRVSGTFTTGSTTTGVVIVIDSNTATIGAGFDIDGIQVERQIGALVTPSPWTPPGSTSIDAGIIRTGQLQSTSSVIVNGASQPAWSINMSGNAQFGDALVRGKMIVGSSGDVTVNEKIANGNIESATISNFTAYDTGSGTLPALTISRTTTAGEVISGTASLKVATSAPAAGSSRTNLGISIALASSANAGDKVDVSFTVNPDVVTGWGYYVTYLNGGTVVGNNSVGVFADAANTATTYYDSFTVPSGQTITNIRIVQSGALAPLTTTKIIFDNLSANVSVPTPASSIQSYDYVSSTKGWRIGSDGSVEFNDGVFRGTLYAADGTFTGAVSGGSIAGGTARFPDANTASPGFTAIDINGFSVNNDTTTNLCTNPSLESLTGVSASSGTTAVLGGAVTTDYVSNVDNVAYTGAWALKVYNTTASGYVDINVGAANASTTYTVSWVSATTNINDTAASNNAQGDYSVMGVIRSDTSARIATGRTGYVLMGGGPYQGFQFGSASSGIDVIGYLGWQMRTWLTFTTPADLPAGTQLKLRLPAPRTSANGNETTLAVVYDALQMEAKPYMTRYTDGDQPGCSWSGTRHASTSTRNSQKSFWVPTYDEPVFNGKVNSAIIQTSKIKLGTGAAHGSNYIERYNSALQTFNTGVWSDIPWDSNAGTIDRTSADDGTIMNGFTKFIGNTPGVYAVSASYGWANNANGARGLRIVVQNPAGTNDYVQAVNGPVTASAGFGGTTNHSMSIASMVYLPVGWTVRIQAYQSSGGLLNGQTHTSSTPCKVAFALVT